MADVILGHDEDGDGIPDTGDLCPHVADDGVSDGDGDLVGDACDPEPANNRQFWITFDPLVGDSTYFNTGPEWTQKADSIECAAASLVQLVRGANLLDVDFVLGLDTLGVAGTYQKIGIVLRRMAVTQYNYAELFDVGAGSHLDVMEFDGTSFNLLARGTLAPTTPLGTGYLRVHATATGTPSLTIDGDIAGSSTSATNAASNYIGADIVVIGLTNIAVEIRYVAIIGSNLP